MTGRLYGWAVSIAVAVLTLLVAGVPWAEADTLYGATGSNGVNGELVILNPATGAVLTVIGPLDDESGNHYGITGLAFQPGTGGSVLFGSTAQASPTAHGHLVKIDPLTARVSDVGSYGISGLHAIDTMSDITFDPTSGTLYGNSGGTEDFYTINLTTGAATALGLTGVSFTTGGGLAANAAGTIFGAPNGSSSNLFTYNKTTGQATFVAPLSGAPFPNGAIGAMAFNSVGTLFGVNNATGAPAQTHLVTINPTTGVITDAGASRNNLDAIAFQPTPPTPIPALSPFGQALFVCVVFLSGLLFLRRWVSWGG